MKKICPFLLVAIFSITACDLQPKIVALPDTVGQFITERYPTLLADPQGQPEIYNSAATDYGVYASPELYGSSGTDDYVLYSSVDDYIVPPQPNEEPEEQELTVSEDTAYEETTKESDNTDDFISDDVLIVSDKNDAEDEDTEEETQDDIAWDENSNIDDKLEIPMYGGDIYTEITVVAGDTLYLLGKKYNMTVEELALTNNLSEPYLLSVGQKLRVRVPSEHVISEIPKLPEQKVEPKPESKTTEKPVAKTDVSRKTTTRVEVDTITIEPGDTLYSLSRKYSVPVNDLAVMNNLVAPFALYAGQQLKVPDLSSAPVRSAKPTVAIKQKAHIEKQVAEQETKQTAKQQSAKQQTKQVAQKQNKPEQKPKQQKDKTKQQDKPTTKQTVATNKKPAITARSSSKFSWPIQGKILSNYGAKTNGLFNDGINIAATPGTLVKAAENGVVAYAGNEVKGMGNLVIIQHSEGWMTVYAHMDSMSVHRGARVNVGQKIGTVGKTGKVDKPQLHFEIRKGTKAYNPIQYLKK